MLIYINVSYPDALTLLISRTYAEKGTTTRRGMSSSAWSGGFAMKQFLSSLAGRRWRWGWASACCCVRPWRNAATRCTRADPLLRNPITGIAGCCARAASGHAAAAPPSRVMELAPSHVEHRFLPCQP